MMLWRYNIPFEYILDGDISDLTDDVIDRYFTGQLMADPTPPTSCAYKHLLAYKKILADGLYGALILEDDIILRSNFVTIFNQSIDEVKEYEITHPGPIIISYEDTRLRFVPRSQRKEDCVIYKGDCDRMTGAYYINAAAAKLILDYAIFHKMDSPIDITHCQLLRNGLLDYLWCQPTIATQGSHTGAFASAINFHKSVFYPLTWQFKLAYKKLLYWFR